MNTKIDNSREVFLTFSVKGRSDVLGAHLETRSISLEDWLQNQYIVENQDRQKYYKLRIEYKALRDLIRFGEIEALVSFQRTKHGNYAIARLKEDKENKEDQKDRK